METARIPNYRQHEFFSTGLYVAPVQELFLLVAAKWIGGPTSGKIAIRPVGDVTLGCAVPHFQNLQQLARQCHSLDFPHF
jgi:hypothetical protein